MGTVLLLEKCRQFQYRILVGPLNFHRQPERMDPVMPPTASLGSGWRDVFLARLCARTYKKAMGQQLRIRAKRKRRKAYLDRRKAKRKAPPPKAPRAKVKKEAAPS